MTTKRRPARKIIAARPAETGAIAGSVALLIGHWIGITDPETLVAIGAVIGFIPAAITWLVNLTRS